MSPTKQSQRQRKNVTTACIPCRESKVKCDGESPSCSNCQNKYRTCCYQIGGDKRKLSLRLAVDLLVGRVGQLSRFIIDTGHSPPSTPPEDDTTLNNVLESVGLGHVKSILGEFEMREKELSDFSITQNLEPFNTEPNPLVDNVNSTLMDHDFRFLQIPGLESDGRQCQPQHAAVPSLPASSGGSLGSGLEIVTVENLEDGVLSEPFWHPITEDGVQPSVTQPPDAPGSHNSGERRDDFGSDDSPSDSEGMEKLINKLSSRMGSLQIGSDGRIRYYGPTSHFNLLKMPVPDNLTVHRTVRKDGQDLLHRLGIGKAVPLEFEERLINLYFTWHNPSLYVVDRELYDLARQKWHTHKEDTPYYSEALTNAMCCLGAAFEPRYHPDFITYPKSVSDFFADRAKALLDIELDSPCVATVQAMVVLSGHDIGCKRDARGWLYSGMAVRLAFDLGLHIDMASHVADGSISATEAELRRMVFWGAYTLDHLWGFFLGRPFRINMDDVTVDKPGRNMKQFKWSPYGLPTPPTIEISLVDPIELLSQYRVQLCEIMAPLSHVLYGASKISRRTLQELNASATESLLQWKENLPLALQVNVDDSNTIFLPHVLLLHMQYFQFIIHTHRPWMSKRYLQPQPPQGAGYMHARKMCIESAVAIAKLLHPYEIRYTFRRINIQAVAITCSSALMLIFATVSNRQLQEGHATSIHLSVCFRALEEFGLSWESAKRAQTFLMNLRRIWEGQIYSRHPSKRVISQSQTRSQSRSSGTKRTRISSGSDGRESSVLLGDLDPSQSPDSDDCHMNSNMLQEFNWLWATSMGAISPPIDVPDNL